MVRTGVDANGEEGDDNTLYGVLDNSEPTQCSGNNKASNRRRICATEFTPSAMDQSACVSESAANSKGK